MGWDPTERSEYSYQGTYIIVRVTIFGSHLSLDIQGTPTGDISNVTYPATDPDCWWTSSRCVTPKLPSLVGDIANVPEVCDVLF
jgi:hypothetical protein